MASKPTKKAKARKGSPDARRKANPGTGAPPRPPYKVCVSEVVQMASELTTEWMDASDASGYEALDRIHGTFLLMLINLEEMRKRYKNWERESRSKKK